MAVSHCIPKRLRSDHPDHPPFPARDSKVSDTSGFPTYHEKWTSLTATRWLYSHGFKAESITVLANLQNCNEDDPSILSTKAEMEASLELEKEATKFSIKDLIHDKTEVKNTRRLILCFMTQFWQQFTGINVIAFYVMIVLESNVGLARPTASLIAGCIQIVFWLGTFPPMILLDRVGRRPMLLLGSVALLTCMALFTVGIAVDTKPTAKMALAFLFLYEISFGMSWNSIPWLYSAEISTLKLRHVGAAAATFSEWLWTFVSQMEILLEDAANKPVIGHCSHYAVRDCERWMEVLSPLLRHDSTEHSVHLFLLPRGKRQPVYLLMSATELTFCTRRVERPWKKSTTSSLIMRDSIIVVERAQWT